MYDTNIFLQAEINLNESLRKPTYRSSRQDALKLFRSALVTGRMHKFLGKLFRKNRSLIDLDKARFGKKILGSYTDGIKAVSISQIRGSEGRSADFDTDFHPVQEHTRDRWVGVAKARMNGVALPPVELVRMGETYFVRDGHHRISVARSLGQEIIDAEVTVLRVDEVWMNNHPVAACYAGL